MNTSINNYDSLEQLVYNEDIRIQAIDIHVDIDLMLVILNTGFVIKEKLSRYFKPDKAEQHLLDFRLIGGGTGIHWCYLDIDLSLKGLLKESFRSQLLAGKGA